MGLGLIEGYRLLAPWLRLSMEPSCKFPPHDVKGDRLTKSDGIALL